MVVVAVFRLSSPAETYGVCMMIMALTTLYYAKVSTVSFSIKSCVRLHMYTRLF